MALTINCCNITNYSLIFFINLYLIVKEILAMPENSLRYKYINNRIVGRPRCINTTVIQCTSSKHKCWYRYYIIESYCIMLGQLLTKEVIYLIKLEPISENVN